MQCSNKPVGATFLTPDYLPICFENVDGHPVKCPNDILGDVAVSVSTGRMWTTGRSNVPSPSRPQSTLNRMKPLQIAHLLRGGFSDYDTAASFQTKAREHYLQVAEALPPSSMFNSSARAFPDVSFAGHNFLVVMDSEVVAVYGMTVQSFPVNSFLCPIPKLRNLCI